MPIINTLKIEKAGTLRWNDAKIDRARLIHYLDIVPRMNPVPMTVLKVDADADCATVEQIRDQLEKQLQCKSTKRCGEGEGV